MSERNEATIEQVRAARGRISAQFGHDPKRLVTHYIEMQKQYQTRLLPVSIQGDEQDQKAA